MTSAIARDRELSSSVKMSVGKHPHKSHWVEIPGLSIPSEQPGAPFTRGE